MRSKQWDDQSEHYRREVLKLDPGATISTYAPGTRWWGYVVKDSAGHQIGWTEGNETDFGDLNAWLRALSALQRRAPTSPSAAAK